MPTVEVRTPAGEPAGTVTLDDAVFGITPNDAVMHQVVVAQLAARRRGTHKTKGRAEVRGGGAKPWRQKGTGRARQGSIRAPHWTGGGVAHGPVPRSYRQRTPRKMRQLALRSALSDRAAAGRIVVVDAWSFERPRTAEAAAALAALGCTEGRVLVVLDPADDVAARSFRNIPRVQVLPADQLNTYDVLCADWIVFTEATLPGSAPGATAAAVAEPRRAQASAAEPSGGGSQPAGPTGVAEPADTEES